MSISSLQYLSADQALGDLCKLIEFVMKEYNTTSSQVVTVGGSYAGNLAAWFRLKYPSTSTVSVASSAPLTADKNFIEYMEVVQTSIEYYSGSACNNALRLAADVVMTKPYATLTSDFMTCELVADQKDFSVLLSNLMGNIQGVVQYHDPANSQITQLCDVMLNGSDAYEQFKIVSRSFLGKDECDDANWNNTIAFLSNTTLPNPNFGVRQWLYQTCNEFGYYQTTDSSAQPFHSWTVLNTSFYDALCYESFSSWKYEPAVVWTNANYGDIRIGGTNIIFPAGSIDPWHALGVVDTTVMAETSERSLFIVGTSHCDDLKAPSSSDLPALTQARLDISAFITSVLAPVAETRSVESLESCDNDDNVVISLSVFLAITSVALIYLLVDKFYLSTTSKALPTAFAAATQSPLRLNDSMPHPDFTTIRELSPTSTNLEQSSLSSTQRTF